MAFVACLPKASGVAFLKTRMCTFNARGKCGKGESCRFAHSADELKSLPDLYKTRPCLAFMRSGKCREGSSCQYAHSENELRICSSTPRVQWHSVQEQLAIRPAMPDEEVEKPDDLDVPWSRQTSGEHPDKIDDVDNVWSRQVTGEGLEPEGVFERQESDFSCWSQSFDRQTSSQSIPASDAEKIPEACEAKKSAMRKTRMCKFSILGKCSRGDKCNFAHTANDLQPQPDFYRTRPCLAILKSGWCRDGDACKYAHSMEDIRGDTTNSQVFEATSSPTPLSSEACLVEANEEPRKVPRCIVPLSQKSTMEDSRWSDNTSSAEEDTQSDSTQETEPMLQASVFSDESFPCNTAHVCPRAPRLRPAPDPAIMVEMPELALPKSSAPVDEESLQSTEDWSICDGSMSCDSESTTHVGDKSDIEDKHLKDTFEVDAAGSSVESTWDELYLSRLRTTFAPHGLSLCVKNTFLDVEECTREKTYGSAARARSA